MATCGRLVIISRPLIVSVFILLLNNFQQVSAFSSIGWSPKPSFRQGRIHQVLTSSSATVNIDADATNEISKNYSSTTKKPFTFESPEMQIYIEDTDAYGIMYNTNYLRAYDRALHMSSTSIGIQNNIESITSQHEGWSIVSFGEQKFKSSPRLGESYVIRGKLKSTKENCEVWDMQMTSPNGETVYNTITDLQISKQTSNNLEGNLFSLENVGPFALPDDDARNSTTSTVYRDEIDAHWPGHLPLRNILNLFERSRSDMLGGPDALRLLQQKDGAIVVVTAIKSCCLIDEGVVCYPGQKLVTETLAVPKRRGMVIECYQTVRDGDSRIAQGQVNLMILDSETRRPTTKVSKDILARTQVNQ